MKVCQSAALQEDIRLLLAEAEAESGSSDMTTHEAKEHFRRNGRESAARRLQLLLCELAAVG